MIHLNIENAYLEHKSQGLFSKIDEMISSSRDDELVEFAKDIHLDVTTAMHLVLSLPDRIFSQVEKNPAFELYTTQKWFQEDYIKEGIKFSRMPFLTLDQIEKLFLHPDPVVKHQICMHYSLPDNLKDVALKSKDYAKILGVCANPRIKDFHIDEIILLPPPSYELYSKFGTLIRHKRLLEWIASAGDRRILSDLLSNPFIDEKTIQKICSIDSTLFILGLTHRNAPESPTLKIAKKLDKENRTNYFTRCHSARFSENLSEIQSFYNEEDYLKGYSLINPNLPYEIFSNFNGENLQQLCENQSCPLHLLSELIDREKYSILTSDMLFNPQINSDTLYRELDKMFEPESILIDDTPERFVLDLICSNSTLDNQLSRYVFQYYTIKNEMYTSGYGGTVYSIPFSIEREITKFYDKYNNSTDDKKNLGYIYMAINPSMPGLIKIGATQNEPQERIRQLSSNTSVPTEFILVYYQMVSRPFEIEGEFHRYLDVGGYRNSPNREFFNISTKSAIDEFIAFMSNFE